MKHIYHTICMYISYWYIEKCTCKNIIYIYMCVCPTYIYVRSSFRTIRSRVTPFPSLTPVARVRSWWCARHAQPAESWGGEKWSEDLLGGMAWFFCYIMSIQVLWVQFCSKENHQNESVSNRKWSDPTFSFGRTKSWPDTPTSPQHSQNSKDGEASHLTGLTWDFENGSDAGHEGQASSMLTIPWEFSWTGRAPSTIFIPHLRFPLWSTDKVFITLQPNLHCHKPPISSVPMCFPQTWAPMVSCPPNRRTTPATLGGQGKVGQFYHYKLHFHRYESFIVNQRYVMYMLCPFSRPAVSKLPRLASYKLWDHTKIRASWDKGLCW